MTSLDYFFRFIGSLRWVRLGIRYRLIFSLAKKNDLFEVPFFGYKYKGNLSDYIDKYVFYFGAYELEELMFLKKYINKDSVVIDIGANSGHHSIFFSKFASKVYSFEPYKKVFDLMIERIKYNNIKNIECFNVGLGKEDSLKDFFPAIGPNQGMGSFLSEDSLNSIGKLEVKDASKFILNKTNKVDVIKIDVEGMESQVVDGLSDLIKFCRPLVFIECNKDFQLNINKYLSSFGGYKAYIIDANNPFLVFFNKPCSKITEFKKPLNFTQNILFIPFEKEDKGQH